MTAATDGHYKLLRRGDEEVVYDLQRIRWRISPLDPGGLHAETQTLRAAISHASTSTRAAPSETGAEEEISDEDASTSRTGLRLLGLPRGAEADGKGTGPLP